MANQNIFTVRGTVDKIYPEQSGESRNGHWTKQEFILKNEERNYLYRYCFTLFGRRTDDYRPLIQTGKALTVTFGVDTNIFDERAFTSLRVIDIVPTDAQLDAMQQALGADGQQPQATPQRGEATTMQTTDANQADAPF